MTRRDFVIVTLCALALCFTRYAGLAIVLGVGAMIPGWRRKLAVVLPTLVVYIAGLYASHALTGHLAWRWGTIWYQGGQTGRMFVMLAQGLPLLGFLAWAVGTCWREVEARILAGAIVAYMVGIWLVATLNDAKLLAYDDRLFLPAVVLLWLLLLGVVIRQLPKAYPWILAGVVAYMVICNVGQGRAMSVPGSKGFNAPIWRQSDAIAIIRDKVPPAVPIHSNAVDAIWYLCGGRKAKWLPKPGESVVGVYGCLAWFRERSVPAMRPESLRAAVGVRWVNNWQDSISILAEVKR